MAHSHAERSGAFGPTMNQPELHTTASARLVVAVSDLANQISAEPGDTFPPVFATSRMVALMEIASARLLRPFLKEGELSVGVTINVSHTAATPLGATVTATARYIGREEKHYLFEVVASDPGGEIGKGTHRRAIIAAERLLSGAARRTG